MNNLIQCLNKIILPKTNIITAYNVLKQYNADDWKQYKPEYKCAFNKQLIHDNTSYQLYLISWNRTISDWHAHSQYGCLLKVLEGELQEHVIIKNNIHINYLSQHMIVYKAQNELHSVVVPRIAYSLHIYS